MTTYFVLRERATGRLLPLSHVKTRAEFGDKGVPRLLTSAGAAKQALDCWRMGYWTNKIDSYGESEGPMPSEWQGNAAIAARRQAVVVDVVPMQLVPERQRTKAKQRRPMHGNYYVIDRGRAYRVCATSSDRVLMVMLKHRHKEQALGQARRAAEVIRAAEKKYGKVFLKS